MWVFCLCLFVGCGLSMCSAVVLRGVAWRGTSLGAPGGVAHWRCPSNLSLSEPPRGLHLKGQIYEKFAPWPGPEMFRERSRITSGSRVVQVVQGQDCLGRVWESEFWAENKGGPLSPYSE